MIYIFAKILVGIGLLIMNSFLYLGNLYDYGKSGMIWTAVSGFVLAADCFCIMFLMRKGMRFLINRKNQNNQKELEIAIRTQAEDQRTILLEERRLEVQQCREAERIRLLEQEKRENEAKVKADDLTQKYSLEGFVFEKKKNIWSGKKRCCDPVYLNTEVIDAVEKYGVSVQDIYQKANELKRKSNDILSRSDFSTECDRLQYLNENQARLAEMLGQIEKLQAEYLNSKILLPVQDMEICRQHLKAFSMIETSEKFSSDDITRESMLKCNDPEGLSLFENSVTPLILFIQDFYYCLFSNIILVFDKDGFFSTALTSAAFSVQSERVSKNVYSHREGYGTSERYEHSDLVVGADSNLIKEGNPEIMWLHARKDGSCDRRYRYNPTYVTRWDIWEYGSASIKILDMTIKFQVSSVQCADALGELNRNNSDK